jgi:hypothetical protein
MHGFGVLIARDLRAMLDSYILQLLILILLAITLTWEKRYPEKTYKKKS